MNPRICGPPAVMTGWSASSRRRLPAPLRVSELRPRAGSSGAFAPRGRPGGHGRMRVEGDRARWLTRKPQYPLADYCCVRRGRKAGVGRGPPSPPRERRAPRPPAVVASRRRSRREREEARRGPGSSRTRFRNRHWQIGERSRRLAPGDESRRGGRLGGPDPLSPPRERYRSSTPRVRPAPSRKPGEAEARRPGSGSGASHGAGHLKPPSAGRRPPRTLRRGARMRLIHEKETAPRTQHRTAPSGQGYCDPAGAEDI